MTHRLGRGTVNVSANLLREEREHLGRIAVKLDTTISRMLRDAALNIIERHDPAAGRGLVRCRRNRRRDQLSRCAGQLALDL